eukprot:XP_022277418.1 protein stum homolog [Canis lupus familiaris]
MKGHTVMETLTGGSLLLFLEKEGHGEGSRFAFFPSFWDEYLGRFRGWSPPSQLPAAGTFVSAFAVLCGARTDLPDRHVCCVFWLNIAAALIQTLTAIVMVGWIMSIFWGMDMVILASYKEQGIPQQL